MVSMVFLHDAEGLIYHLLPMNGEWALKPAINIVQLSNYLSN